MNMPFEEVDSDLREFLKTGLDLKLHLAKYLKTTINDINNLLLKGSEELAALHPKTSELTDPTSFYEEGVGTAHLLDLASWHLGSAEYIADTLKLLKMFSRGNVLDFGGGIGTHALFAAALDQVDHVCFVDINPQNRSFVEQRAKALALDSKISFHRDLNSTGNVRFDFVVCLDVLEHLPDPSSQLLCFLERMNKGSIALLNWYFFKGFSGEYPFHFDDEELIEGFFNTLQKNFLEVFHPLLITARTYKPLI